MAFVWVRTANGKRRRMDAEKAEKFVEENGGEIEQTETMDNQNETEEVAVGDESGQNNNPNC